MDGILNIHKPSGPTSFAVVARVRKLVNEPKSGHGGTLDPLASGVLPIFLGQATRLAEYLMEYSKTYRAEITLGVATDSFDSEGKVTGRGEVSAITQSAIESALGAFRGDIMQTPPVYSALKHQGQPLYKLAREGHPVEPESRPATVYRLELVSYVSPVLVLNVECSKGTYIRSLAHELGAALGCGAHLTGLVRSAYGPFDIKNAITPEQLESAVADSTCHALLEPMDTVLSLWQKILLSDEQLDMVRCGALLTLEVAPETRRLRAYDKSDRFAALLEYDTEGRAWHPQKVFHRLPLDAGKRPNP